MNPIPRRTLLTSLGASLLPLAGCGGGKSGSNSREVDPPNRGVGSFYWRTLLGLNPPGKSVIRIRHETTDNTLRVITQANSNTGPLTEYTLDFDTGRVRREKTYPYDSSEAEAIKRFLSEEGRMEGMFRKDTPSTITRLAPATLQPLWTYSVDPQTEYDPTLVIMHNPIIAPDGTVYLVTEHTYDGRTPRVRALDGATGQLKWVGGSFFSPTLSSGSPYRTPPPATVEAVLGPEGVIAIEAGWKKYSEQVFPIIGQAVLIIHPQTGGFARVVPLFDDRGVWNISFTQPLPGPSGTLIGIYTDSLVAIRIK